MRSWQQSPFLLFDFVLSSFNTHQEVFDFHSFMLHRWLSSQQSNAIHALYCSPLPFNHSVLIIVFTVWNGKPQQSRWSAPYEKPGLAEWLSRHTDYWCKLANLSFLQLNLSDVNCELLDLIRGSIILVFQCIAWKGKQPKWQRV